MSVCVCVVCMCVRKQSNRVVQKVFGVMVCIERAGLAMKRYREICRRCGIMEMEMKLEMEMGR